MNPYRNQNRIFDAVYCYGGLLVGLGGAITTIVGMIRNDLETTVGGVGFMYAGGSMLKLCSDQNGKEISARYLHKISKSLEDISEDLKEKD